MIKKLRRNFIITAMISVVSVLIIIVGVINTANFINSDSEADALLAFLADNGGSFGQNDPNDIPPEKPDGEAPPDAPGEGFRNYPMRRFGDIDIMTAETPYETRFFTVILNESGEPAMTDTGKIAAVDDDTALEMARAVVSEHKTSGYTDNYKYLVRYGENSDLCIFIDRTRSLASVRDFLKISLLVSLGATAAIFVLVFIFSGAVIRPIAESYEKQKKFITDAGHELKTPLAVINSCAEVIEAEQGESKWTKGITSQTERLSQLTKELVALARMDENGGQLNCEEFSLSETLGEIIDPFAIPAEQKGIVFTDDIQPDITYKGDKSMIAKLCSILADNAVKYTPEDGRISFSLSRKGRRILLVTENTAADTEKGPHPEFFDRFRRGDASHSSDTPGYGIGLSMAQSIVSAHGGRIDAFSKDGKSLTITVRL